MKRVSVICIAVVFFSNSLLIDNACPYIVDKLPDDIPVNRQFAELDVETLKIPMHLGLVKHFSQNNSNRSVIHIQDAHCNMFAQQKVAGIIDYLQSEYGIKVVNMEGGARDYDLGPFTSIDSATVRKEIASYFLKSGDINGAEFFAITNPGRIELWGVEDKELYLKNLQVYRDSLKYRGEVEKYLSDLTRILNNFKKHLYGKELLNMDMTYSAYKTGNIEMRDYMEFLIKKAGNSGIDMKDFPNLLLMAKSIQMEADIDFNRANKERDILVKELKKRLSKDESRQLLAETIDFKTKRISTNTFYEYLRESAGKVKLDISKFRELSRYIEYVGTYEKAKFNGVIEELGGLEKAIKEKLYDGGLSGVVQRELNELSRNLVLYKNMFTITLNKPDYEFFINNRPDFKIENYVSFIERNKERYNVDAVVPDGIEDVEKYSREIIKFYEYSFKRDEKFIDNIKFSESGGAEVSILITGGFHSENLYELFDNAGISYASVIPKFTTEENYKNPYFDLLGGGATNLQRMLSSSLAKASMLMIASKLSGLGKDVWGDAELNTFRAAVKVLSKLREEAGEDIFRYLTDEVEITRGNDDNINFVFNLSEGRAPVEISVNIRDIFEGVGEAQAEAADTNVIKYQFLSSVEEGPVDITSTELSRRLDNARNMAFVLYDPGNGEVRMILSAMKESGLSHYALKRAIGAKDKVFITGSLTPNSPPFCDYSEATAVDDPDGYRKIEMIKILRSVISSDPAFLTNYVELENPERSLIFRDKISGVVLQFRPDAADQVHTEIVNELNRQIFRDMRLLMEGKDPVSIMKRINDELEKEGTRLYDDNYVISDRYRERFEHIAVAQYLREALGKNIYTLISNINFLLGKEASQDEKGEATFIDGSIIEMISEINLLSEDSPLGDIIFLREGRISINPEWWFVLKEVTENPVGIYDLTDSVQFYRIETGSFEGKEYLTTQFASEKEFDYLSMANPDMYKYLVKFASGEVGDRKVPREIISKSLSNGNVREFGRIDMLDGGEMVVDLNDPLKARSMYRASLGNKGANLGEIMNSDRLADIRTTDGFIITTDAFRKWMENGKRLGDLEDIILQAAEAYKERTGREFIVSVRSGATVSMPGMMDTVLKVKMEPYIDAEGKRVPGLIEAVENVFNSWYSRVALDYKKQNAIPDELGTAVVVQGMVFGDKDDDSFSGVVLTRNPNNGKKELYGNYLHRSTGEKVVAGRGGKVLEKKDNPGRDELNRDLFEELERCADELERYYGYPQDIEFTVESGVLYIMQTRDMIAEPLSTVSIISDLVDEGMISEDEAFRRAYPVLKGFSRSELRGVETSPTIAEGQGSSPGAVSGVGVFVGKDLDADGLKEKELEVEWIKSLGNKVIIIAEETDIEHIPLLKKADGIMTIVGGQTSHAAIYARSLGKPAIVGLGDNGITMSKNDGGSYVLSRQIDFSGSKMDFDVLSEVFLNGIGYTQPITFDGSTGMIYGEDLSDNIEESKISAEEYSAMESFDDILEAVWRIRTGASLAEGTGAAAGKLMEIGGREFSLKPNASGEVVVNGNTVRLDEVEGTPEFLAVDENDPEEMHEALVGKVGFIRDNGYSRFVILRTGTGREYMRIGNAAAASSHESLAGGIAVKRYTDGQIMMSQKRIYFTPGSEGVAGFAGTVTNALENLQKNDYLGPFFEGFEVYISSSDIAGVRSSLLNSGVLSERDIIDYDAGAGNNMKIAFRYRKEGDNMPDELDMEGLEIEEVEFIEIDPEDVMSDDEMRALFGNIGKGEFAGESKNRIEQNSDHVRDSNSASVDIVRSKQTQLRGIIDENVSKIRKAVKARLVIRKAEKARGMGLNSEEITAIEGLSESQLDSRLSAEERDTADAQIDTVYDNIDNIEGAFVWFYAMVGSAENYLLGYEGGLAVNVVEYLNELDLAGYRAYHHDLVAEYILHELLEKTVLEHSDIIALTGDIFRRSPVEKTRRSFSGDDNLTTPLGDALGNFIDYQAMIGQGELDDMSLEDLAALSEIKDAPGGFINAVNILIEARLETGVLNKIRPGEYPSTILVPLQEEIELFQGHQYAKLKNGSRRKLKGDYGINLNVIYYTMGDMESLRGGVDRALDSDFLQNEDSRLLIYSDSADISAINNIMARDKIGEPIRSADQDEAQKEITEKLAGRLSGIINGSFRTESETENFSVVGLLVVGLGLMDVDRDVSRAGDISRVVLPLLRKMVENPNDIKASMTEEEFIMFTRQLFRGLFDLKIKKIDYEEIRYFVDAQLSVLRSL